MIILAQGGNQDIGRVELGDIMHYLTKKITLLEKARKDSDIREIVRDIITIFKKEDEGEFY